MSTKISKNFILEEFNSKDGAKMPEDVKKNVLELVKHIQIIRDTAGVPLVINSGYRSPAHNAKTPNASKNSTHVFGKAGDLNPQGKITTKKLYDLILKLITDGVIYNGGVGLYDTFVHYDIGGKGRRWNYSTKYK